jgi:hypothetical protein
MSSSNINLQPNIVRPYLSHSKIQIHFTETPNRTLSDPAEHCLNLPKKAPIFTESQPDIV